jgi:hypothetical protein
MALFFPTLLFEVLFGNNSGFYHYSTDLSYWYAILLIVISYIMLKSLLTENLKAIKFVLEGYLLGDFLQLLVIFIRIPLALEFNIGIVFTILFTIILIISRSFCLFNPEMLGFSK